MPLFLITGTAGTGKTAVCRELKKRGYDAYDTDEDALAKWQHKQTGFVHPKSSVKKEDRTPEFLENHSWTVPREDVEALAKRAVNKPVFLCGALGNEDAVRDEFAALYELYVDAETLQHRLATRPGDNAWGKQEHELRRTLAGHEQAHAKYVERGNIVIDAHQPLEKVVEAILKAAQAA